MSGRPRDVADDQILWELFRRTDPAFAASEIGDFVGMSRQGIHDRLVELENGGFVGSKRPGRDRMWWITPKGEKRAEQYGGGQDQSTQ